MHLRVCGCVYITSVSQCVCMHLCMCLGVCVCVRASYLGIYERMYYRVINSKASSMPASVCVGGEGQH